MEETIKQRLDRIAEKITEIEETKGKEKKFKMPYKIRLFGRFRVKQNYAIVLLIRTNGSAKITMVKIADDTIRIKDKVYDASADYIMRYKRYPLIIITEWNIEPFSPKDNYQKAVDKGTLTSAEKVILNTMRNDAIKPKWSGNWGAILIVIAVLVGGALLLNKLGLIKF